jgi:hypothetical protein
MKQPGPPQDRRLADRESAQTRKPGPGRDEGPRILVHYYHKMKWQRVHTMRVAWEAKKGPHSDDAFPAVVIRPSIPGAIVTPPEQTLGAAPSSEVTFYVTSLALGKIPAARVEVLAAGTTAEDISLPMKTVRQRLTRVLLALTILVPAFLLWVLKFEPLEGTIPHKVPTFQANMPPPGNDQPRPPLPPAGSAPQSRTIKEPGTPGEVLAYQLDQEQLVPKIPYVTEPVLEGLKVSYDFLWILSANDPLAFYVGLGLLVLTGVSWFAHLSARGRRRSRPIRLAPQEAARDAVRVPPSEGSEEPLEIIDISPGQAGASIPPARARGPRSD